MELSVGYQGRAGKIADHSLELFLRLQVFLLLQIAHALFVVEVSTLQRGLADGATAGPDRHRQSHEGKRPNKGRESIYESGRNLIDW